MSTESFSQPMSLQDICLQRMSQQLSGTCRSLVNLSQQKSSMKDQLAFIMQNIKLQYENMPPFLRAGPIEKTMNMLYNLSQKSSTEEMLAFTIQTVRLYYINLPAVLRVKLIEKTMEMLYKYYPGNRMSLIFKPMILYLLAILLKHDTTQLTLTFCHCRDSHQISIVQLLASQGIDFQSLEWYRSTYVVQCIDYILIYKTLLNTRNLSSLMLPHIADNNMLLVIGRSCPRLAFLDVSHSEYVTDEGLKELVMRWKQNPEYNRLRFKLVETLKKSGNSQEESQMNKCDGYKNALCDTLTVLNVNQTNVSYIGILFVLINAPQLKSFMKYSNIGKAIEIMHKTYDHLYFPLNLIEATIYKITPRRFELLAQACPKIKKLHIFELEYSLFQLPQYSSNVLTHFSQLTYLTIQNAEINPIWMNNFQDYLQNNGKNLCYLNFDVESMIYEIQVDLRKILISCPNLHTLIAKALQIIWTQGCDPAPLNLKFVHLKYTTTALVIVKLLSLAPKLETFHIFDCPSLTDEDLKMIKSPNRFNTRMFNPYVEDSLSNLCCFYIYRNTISITSLLNVFSNCKQLEYLGNFKNWGTSDEEAKVKEIVRGTNIKLCSYSHWEQDKCIPSYNDIQYL